KDYIKYIRGMVGHKRILMNFAVATIFNAKGELLLQKRGDKKKWGLVGGTLELGETLEECVKREVFEETGLKIIPTSIIGIYTGPEYNILYPNRDKVQPVSVLFNVKVIGGKLRDKYDKETLDLKYFTKHNLPELANKDFKDMIQDAFDRKIGIWH
ncbi:MAG: NUDIX domain-containing protein, partial [Candidatus Woesebacteria bacterium]|nr:NUDIX domain-containing protein [Candidatus Woesebacteria bacterium]